MYEPRPTIRIIADSDELRERTSIWGTGGWLPPERREALDWLTLVRFLGLEVTVSAASSFADDSAPPPTHCLIVACPVDALGERGWTRIKRWMAEEPLLVVTRGIAGESPSGEPRKSTCEPRKANGKLRWVGLGHVRSWDATGIPLQPLQTPADGLVWATLGNEAIVHARPRGRGTLAMLAFHPSAARDADPSCTALLKHLVIYGSPPPIAWLDLRETLVLRMDDPGGSQNVHNRNWAYPKLNEDQWRAIAADLCDRQARLSVGYVSGWVDDGDLSRGELRVFGELAPRVPGRIFASPTVQYRDMAGFSPGTCHDYAAEFRGVRRLQDAGLGDPELHGYTHLHPDLQAWVQAEDRYDSVHWFRELGARAQPFLARISAADHPLRLGYERHRMLFGAAPTTLICPGDEWTNNALEIALGLGLEWVSSYYQALRHEGQFCWATHLCAPYLDEPSAKWFVAELPVVGYFHDREPALEGTGWIARWLDGWCEAGAHRMIDFRELASAIGRRVACQMHGDAVTLCVSQKTAAKAVRPLTVSLRVAANRLPATVDVLLHDHNVSLPVQFDENDQGKVVVPPDSG